MSEKQKQPEPRQVPLRGHSAVALANWIKESGAAQAAFGGGPRVAADPLDEAIGAMAGAFPQPEPTDPIGRMRAAARKQAGQAQQAPKLSTREQRVDGLKAALRQMGEDERAELSEAFWTFEQEDVDDLNEHAEDFGLTSWGEEDDE